MASAIQNGESLYIPFRDGRSISDSQLKPRMYKTPEAFQKNFPGYYLGTKDVELVEYAPVIRCKECVSYQETVGKDSGKPCGYGSCMNTCAIITGIVYGEDFCSYGERRTDG